MPRLDESEISIFTTYFTREMRITSGLMSVVDRGEWSPNYDLISKIAAELLTELFTKESE